MSHVKMPNDLIVLSIYLKYLISKLKAGLKLLNAFFGQSNEKKETILE